MKTSKILTYIENIYKKNYNKEIEITKIRLTNTDYNRYTIDFEYDYTDGNVEYSNDDGAMYLDLEKISYFDNSID